MAWRVDSVRAVAPQTLRRLGRRHFRDPRLVTLLDRYATYTGSDPRRAPAALARCPTSSRPSALARRRRHAHRSATRCTSGASSAASRFGSAPTSSSRLLRGGVTGVRLARRQPCRRRRRRRQRRRLAPVRPTSSPTAAAAKARRRLERGHAVAVRVRPAARGRGPHARTAAPQRAGSRATTTTSSTRCSSRRPSLSTTRPSTRASPTTRRCVRTTTPSRGSSSSTPRATAAARAAPAPSTGGHRASPTRTPTTCSR